MTASFSDRKKDQKKITTHISCLICAKPFLIWLVKIFKLVGNNGLHPIPLIRVTVHYYCHLS